jgi:lysophospholipase L1-like esterase
MTPLRLVLAALALTPSLAFAQASPTTAQGPQRFAPEIGRFAEADKATPPPKCPIVFTGSSSIRRWTTLNEDMKPLTVLNRGFGGSTVADVDFWFDKVVTPYHPRAIFFYAGDNDIAAGKTPDQVVADFRTFLDLKTKALGATPVWFISVKPSKLRESQLAPQAEVNAGVRKLAAARRDLTFVDVVPAMLANGKPRDLFVADGLHMTPEGYAIWTKLIRPEAEKAAKAPCRA